MPKSLHDHLHLVVDIVFVLFFAAAVVAMCVHYFGH